MVQVDYVLAAGYRLLQNQNRIVRAEGSIRYTATSSLSLSET